MKCQKCGICCIAISINSPQLIKNAGEKCPYLSNDMKCEVWGDLKKQPKVCRTIKPSNDLCRFDLKNDPNRFQKHYKWLSRYERMTK